MVNPIKCRSNASSCIDMANHLMADNLIERDMRERLFALAAAWLELAAELEREAADYEELLSALRRHFQVVSMSTTKH
jgi:hypothetical protein